MVRRDTQCVRDVRVDGLDVAGLVPTAMGAAGRLADLLQAQDFQLLDEQLLGRRCGGMRWRTGNRRAAPAISFAPGARATRLSQVWAS